MPANFPEIWLDRVRTNLSTADQAPWLDGVAEMDADVSQMGEGTATESNMIHVPTSDFEVDVLINNTTYPIPLQAYDDAEITIKLDKYQTKVVTLSDDQIMGASYDRIDNATRKTSEAIMKDKIKKAIHSIAPQSDSTETPVIEATGADDGTGRKRLTYDDLVNLKNKLDANETPQEGRRIVLCSTHHNDLLLDRARFGDKLVNHKTGEPAPMILGFAIYTYIAMPKYNASKTKKAFGAVAAATDKDASIFFTVGNIAKKTGLTKQYFTPAAQDPTGQTNQLSYRHYYIVTPYANKYLGAIL